MNKGVHSICGIIFPNGVSAFFLCLKNLISSVHGILNDYLGSKNGESVFNSGGWNDF